MESDRKQYFNNLDGCRALAALSVVLFHITIWLKFPESYFYQTVAKLISLNGTGGPTGVYFFFTLSGFLITYLMFLEKEKRGTFSIRDFYIRRILRIWPLYFATLVIGFYLYPILLSFFNKDTPHNSSFFLYSIFLANFDNIRTPVYDNGMLGVQWSVAIEEQFYLIWPLLFTIIPKRIFPIVCIMLIFVSFLFFAKNYTNWKIAYLHTVGELVYLSFGALLAWISFFHLSKVNSVLKVISKRMIMIIYVGMILIIVFQRSFYGISPILTALIQIMIVSFFGFIIMEQNFSKNSLIKLGQFSLLRWLGTISYGLYLLHMVAIYLVSNSFNNNPNLIVVESLLVLLTTILLSHLSYQYFEKYFLKLKERFSHLK